MTKGVRDWPCQWDEDHTGPALFTFETDGHCGYDAYSVCAVCALELVGRTWRKTKWTSWSRIVLLNPDGPDEELVTAEGAPDIERAHSLTLSALGRAEDEE